MTHLETIQEHHRLCDEVHQCTLEENRFLRQHQRAPDEALLARKRALLEKLDQGITALRTLGPVPSGDKTTRDQLEKTRTRILQVLQLDKENEQLLLRCSLNGGRVTPAPHTTPSVSMLQKIYARTS